MCVSPVISDKKLASQEKLFPAIKRNMKTPIQSLQICFENVYQPYMKSEMQMSPHYNAASTVHVSAVCKQILQIRDRLGEAISVSP